MTKDQIIALEWAVAQLMDSDAQSNHIWTLSELLDSATSDYLTYDSSKASLVAFMRKHDITIPMAEFDSWRMVPLSDQRRGEINALPESHGILRATNGIMCYIEQPSGALYLGHVQHWQPDPSDVPVRINHNGTAKRVSVADKYLEELFAP